MNFLKRKKQCTSNAPNALNTNLCKTSLTNPKNAPEMHLGQIPAPKIFPYLQVMILELAKIILFLDSEFIRFFVSMAFSKFYF